MVIDLFHVSLSYALPLLGVLMLFAWLCCKNIQLAIAAIIVALPFYTIRLHLGSLPLTMLELLLFILTAVWLWHKRSSISLTTLRQFKKSPLQRSLYLPISLFIIAATTAALLGPNVLTSWGVWKAFIIEPIIFFGIVLDSFKEKNDLQIIINALGLLVLILFPLAVLQHFTGWSIPEAWQAESVRRITSFFGYPNAISLLIAPIIGLYLGLWRDGSIPARIWRFLVIACGLLMILWAQTTGALIALILTALYLLWAEKFWRPIIIMLIMTTLFTATFWLPIRQSWYDSLLRIKHHELGLSANSLEIRADQWRETLHLLKDNPLQGTGLSGYQQALVPYHQHPWLEIFMYPHNLILNFWTETGLLGLIAILWILFFVRQSLWSEMKRKKTSPLIWGLRAAWITWFIHGLVDVPFFKNDLAILFWILVALTLLATNSQERAHATDN